MHTNGEVVGFRRTRAEAQRAEIAQEAMARARAIVQAVGSGSGALFASLDADSLLALTDASDVLANMVKDAVKLHLRDHRESGAEAAN